MRTPFVGRDRELSVLRECLAAALQGRPRLVLCRGEPGIGKTRLAEELSRDAEQAGALVVWGRAPETAGAPPYWVWRQILRAVGDDIDLPGVARGHGLTAELTRLAPDLFPGEQLDANGGGTAEDRFRLFDAVDRLLRLLSRDKPLLIVVDDAHWADHPSLLLLQHLADSLAAQRLLLVVNHRDTEPLGDVLLAGLARVPSTWRLEIGGLSLPEVGAQLSALIFEDVSDGDLQRVHSRTGGNPLYVAEVGRAFADIPVGSTTWPVPAGIREAIGARVDKLPPGTVRMLRAASVVGREFSLAVLADMLGATELACLTQLEPAAAGGLVATDPQGAPRFVHDLVRDAVEAGLAAQDRVRLHRSAAQAIERLHAGRLDPQLSDLARHWAVAAVSGDRELAADWVRRAADEAMRRLAYEEAVRLYRLALAVGAGDIGDESRCRLLLGVAHALQAAGELSDRVRTCHEAAALARGLQRADLLAAAALAMEGGESDLEGEMSVRTSCEEALAALSPAAGTLRAKVSANLSNACMYLGDLEAARRASAHALAMAESCGDRTALAAALRARQLVMSGPEGLTERAILADRMDALGRDGRDPALRMWGHLWRIDVEFQRGDLAAVSRELEPLARCAAAMRTPVPRWHLVQARAVLAQAQGRFGDARRLADQALAALPRSAAGRESAVINRSALLTLIGLHTGEAAELTGLLDYGPGGDRLDFPVEGVIFSVAASFFLAEGGLLADAAAVYRRLGPPVTWRPIPHATTSCFALGLGTAIALNASDDVAVLRARLGQFRGRHVADGAGAVAYNGPVELYLGVAASHLELIDDAVADLEAAREACAANGAAGFEVQARYELADVLARRARPADRARARTLAVAVVDQAAELGMSPWAGRARRLVDRLDDERGSPLTPREREVALLVGEGLTNRQIATRLYLSERTAQNHVQHILTKLGLPNRSQIAVWVAAGK